MPYNIDRVPANVALVNTFLYPLFHFSLGQTICVGAGGAAIGLLKGRAATYATHAALTHLFLDLIHPSVIQPLFFHPYSSASARLVGIILTCAIPPSIPFLFNKYVLPSIKKETPYFGGLHKEQEQSPIQISEALSLAILTSFSWALMNSARSHPI